MIYEDYIRSVDWYKKKEEFKRYNKGVVKCRCCSRKKSIHVHHLHYRNLGHEKMKDLVYLCEECHHSLHSMISRYNRDLRSLSGIFKKFLREQRLYYKNNRTKPLKRKKYEKQKDFKKRIQKERNLKNKRIKKIYSKQEDGSIKI